MKCPYCNTEHPEFMQYCPNTGQRLQKVFKCSNCGNSNIPYGAKFCPKCGNLLKSPDKENIRNFARSGTQKPSKKSFYSGSTLDLVLDIIGAIFCIIIGIIPGIILLFMGDLLGIILIILSTIIGGVRFLARKDFYHFK